MPLIVGFFDLGLFSQLLSKAALIKAKIIIVADGNMMTSTRGAKIKSKKKLEQQRLREKKSFFHKLASLPTQRIQPCASKVPGTDLAYVCVYRHWEDLRHKRFDHIRGIERPYLRCLSLSTFPRCCDHFDIRGLGSHTFPSRRTKKF